MVKMAEDELGAAIVEMHAISRLAQVSKMAQLTLKEMGGQRRP